MSTAGDDGNDCVSAPAACSTINSAIGRAESGDTIYVAEGIYTDIGSEVVLINKDLTLSGGWDEAFAAQTGRSTIDGERVRRGVSVNANTIASLERFTIQNGNKESGRRLTVGEYSVLATAEQYQSTESERFSAGEDQDVNIGNILLQSNPIRFSDVKPCSVPSQGGLCEFSVRITNGLATKFSGRAWSIIEGDGLGSFVNFTDFEADTYQDLNLNPGRSTVLRFRFLMRGSVDYGATICATTFAGQKPNPFFGAAGQHFLFCIQKGTDGFTLMSPTQTHEMQRKMELQPLSGPESVIEKPK